VKNTNKKAYPLLQDWLQFPGVMMSKTKRWGHFKPQTQKQTVLRHTLEQILTTILALAIEWANDNKFSPLYFLTAATTHDFGERGKYDDDYITKNGANKAKIIARERNRVYKFFERLPLPEPEKSCIVSFLKNTYELQYQSDKDGRFFNILEKLGYFSFALKQYRAGRKNFKKVIRSHHQELLKACKKYKSIKILYEPYLSEIKNILK